MTEPRRSLGKFDLSEEPATKRQKTGDDQDSLSLLDDVISQIDERLHLLSQDTQSTGSTIKVPLTGLL